MLRVTRFVYQLAKQFPREQADIFGEQAEHNAIQKTRDFRSFNAALSQPLRDFADAARYFFRDRGTGSIGAQLGWLVENISKDVYVFGSVEIIESDFVSLSGSSRKVRVNHESIHV